MHQRFWTSITRTGVATLALGVFLSGGNSGSDLMAQSPQAKKTTEPVFRVPKVAGQDLVKTESAPAKASAQNTDQVEHVADSRNLPRTGPAPSKVIPAPAPNAAPERDATPLRTGRAPHPLDRAVDFANLALGDMQEEVMDYTAILAKRENIDGVIGPASYMNIKVRCPRTLENGQTTPFSVYMKFLRPKDCAGREVIWVQGENKDNLVVHEGSGIIRLKTFELDPTGRLAMNGQKYPIYDCGLENLMIKLIEKAERDREAGPCVVNYRDGAQINKRPCSLIELIHEDRRAPYEFHKAQVFIDEELQMPVRYAAYDWPNAPGQSPVLLEEYTYYNVKVNVGLKDIDFDRKNPAYKFKF